MKERGHEVGAVRAWREVKTQAAEVSRMAQDLAGYVREWLQHTVERVRDHLSQDQGGFAVAGGDQDLAQQMRQAWKENQERLAPPKNERESSESLAERLRSAFAGVDREAFSEKLSAYQKEREAEAGRQTNEQQRESALEHEKERNISRDNGYDLGM